MSIFQGGGLEEIQSLGYLYLRDYSAVKEVVSAVKFDVVDHLK
jgi:hypothetical protein